LQALRHEERIWIKDSPPLAAKKDDLSHHTGTPRNEALSLSGLRAFVMVVEEESFSRAAEKLGLSQPTVSLQVQALEQACGVRLLIRSRKPALTREGRELLVKARLVLGGLQELESAISGLRNLTHGRISLGFSSPQHALPVLARFLVQHPQVEVSTRAGNTDSLLGDIAACRVDVAVVTLEHLPDGFHCLPIARQRLVLCVRRDHPWAQKRSVRLDQLASQPVVLRELGSMTRRMFERVCSESRISPKQRLEVCTREALKEAVASGLGAGVILDGEFGSDERLQIVRLANPVPDASVYAVCLESASELPAIAAFLKAASTS
jgi:DNA-binding transcriptional LysR family regulator